MPEEYFLQTLGVPRLMTAGGHDIRIRVRKHLAVLVVLAVDGGRIRRDRLVSMFWPYSRPDRARPSRDSSSHPSASMPPSWLARRLVQ